MRQRKVKNEDEKLSAFKDILIEDGRNYKGKWGELFANQQEISLELGCGKGQFLIKKAAENRNQNFIGLEGQRSVVLRALDKTKRAELSNVRFIGEFVKDITEYFSEGEISTLYLNFSDPWPKLKHSKRRLTHGDFLEGYKKVLKKNSPLEFKTDNDALFDFSLTEFEKAGGRVIEKSADLHNSEFNAAHTTTEYEDKFKALGKNINYCKVIFRKEE